MKKRNIILTVLIGILLFTLTGCSKKTVITDADFQRILKESGYTLYDATSQFSSYGIVESASVAQSTSGYQVEFYVLKSESDAISMFNTNKSTFESYKGNSSSESSTSMSNYSTYTLTSAGYYMHLCRVDNTLLYLRVKDTYKKDVQTVVKKLGY